MIASQNFTLLVFIYTPTLGFNLHQQPDFYIRCWCGGYLEASI